MRLPYDSQIEAVHAGLLHTGEVVYWSGYREAAGRSTETRIWNPLTDEIRVITPPSAPSGRVVDLFCSGLSILPDGRVLATGGTLKLSDIIELLPLLIKRALVPLHFTLVQLAALLRLDTRLQGRPEVAVLNEDSRRWELTEPMAGGRWYPSNVTMADGRTAVFTGLDEQRKLNTVVEIRKEDGSWQRCPGAPEDLDVYPRIHLLPDGGLFSSGPHAQSYFFDPKTAAWTKGPRQAEHERDDGCSVLLPLLPEEDYVPRILAFGGGSPAHSSAELIDLSKSEPMWEPAPGLRYARRNANAVLLPNGEVLVIGGNVEGEVKGAVLRPEIYAPDLKSIREATEMAVPRTYHSIALLLPDGRVITAGSTPYGPDELRMELYSPGYCFAGARPRIDSAPDQVSYGETFEVESPDSSSVTGVALMRAGAVTHSFDMEQRYVGLRIIDAGNGRLQLEAPPKAELAPPGYYLLFLLNPEGIPSVGRFVRVGAPVPPA